MAKFYDAKNDQDLDNIEEILESGGIEYSVKAISDGSGINEIIVAEEDVPKAGELLYLSTKRIFCTLRHS